MVADVFRSVQATLEVFATKLHRATLIVCTYMPVRHEVTVDSET